MGGYMQQLIEAVNASNATTFLDWAPIILSVISVLIAVYIPVKLARKENIREAVRCVFSTACRTGVCGLY